MHVENSLSEMPKWDDSLSTGDAIVDEQHQFLFSLLEKIVNDMSTRELTDIVEELAEYTLYHFGYEEKLQKEVGYPGIDQHKKEHESLIRQVEHLQPKIKNGKLSSYVQLRVFLVQWVRDHILNEDQKFILYYQKHHK